MGYLTADKSLKGHFHITNMRQLASSQTGNCVTLWQIKKCNVIFVLCIVSFCFHPSRKEILQEYFDICTLLHHEVVRIHREMASALTAIDPHREYESFIHQNRYAEADRFRSATWQSRKLTLQRNDTVDCVFEGLWGRFLPVPILTTAFWRTPSS